jgi:restriction endonuclease S subunit
LKAKILHIATIQTGFYAKALTEGDLVYLQSKHFDDEGNLSTTLHTDLASSDVAEKHILRSGDILFAAKGSKNFATEYEVHNPPAVASTSFFVIRLSNRNVLPEYLTWFLNTTQVQSLLKSQAKGTSIPSISKQTLEDLEIPIPSIENQKSIVIISKLCNMEKSLILKIETLREKLIQQQIINAIK